MSERPRAIAIEVDARLRAASDAERKAFTEGYFPSALENLGVAVPVIRRIVRDLVRRLKTEDGALVHEIAQAIVDRKTLEGRNVAYLLLNAHPLAIERMTPRILERLGHGMDNWTSVDTFGCYVAGPAWREGRITDAVVKRWARSTNRWWRRAALTCTVALNVKSRGGSGDVPRTVAICRLLAADHDDMVVKGMSWALRGLIGADPSAARAFLAEYDEVLHARVKREVRSKLDTGRKSPRRAAARRRKA